MKINRQQVYDKYNGRCAYCGEAITIKQMQVDHIWPQQLSHWHKDIDPNRPENLNPSCAKCNNFKHGYRLDGDNHGASSFRYELQKQVERLRKNPQFDRALRFGLVQIIDKPVEFYYEKLENRQ
jgi:5-methylcytosine-specific restriction endonuclease McrA